MLKKLVTLFVVICLLAAAVILLNFYPAQPIGISVLEQFVADNSPPEEPVPEEPVIDRLDLMFSHTEHFFDSDIAVSIFPSIPEAVIHYTLDGSEPTAESKVYTSPIRLEAYDRINNGGVYPLKAIAVHGGEVTRPLVHTYFVARDIDVRFNTMIFSISTNDEYLYDYDTGIFVAGRTRAEYRRANPNVRIEPPAPANFNWRGMESERPVYVEIFESDGRRVIAQAAGIRVHGGWSRAEEYKSLRIIPRKIYEPEDGRFQYDFYPGDVKVDEYGGPITRYDQLLLSNNANDRNFGMLRQEVNYALARSAGLRVTPPFRAASVFLNGEYYGFAWLEVIVNEQYLEDIYSAPTQEFQIVGNGEQWVETDDTDAANAIHQFNSFYAKDFSDDKVLADFEAIADLDNLLLYYAFQTYVGNRDWPNNNLKRWRYTGPQEEGLAPELDGRWRYITYDLDFTLSLYEDNVRAGSPSFKDFMTRGNDRYSRMLAALFARPELVDKYAMLICDIASNVLTGKNVATQISLLYDEAYKEIGFAFAARKYDGWVSHNSVENNHTNMIRYANERADYFLTGMREYFGWDDKMFTVEVSGGEAIIGSQASESSTYFAHLTIPVRPALSKHAVFDHWVLNGKIIDTPEITVSTADAKDGVVSIELVTREILPSLVITAAYGASERNGAVLQNTSNQMLTTEGLYFTYDLAAPQLWAMPLATLAPGETLEFAGRGSSDSSDVGKVRMGFNVRVGRVLYLCNEEGDVLDWFVVTTKS